MRSIVIISALLIGQATFAQKNDSLIAPMENVRTMDSLDLYEKRGVRTGTTIITYDSLTKRTNALFMEQETRNVQIQIEGYRFTGVTVSLDGKQKSIERAWKEYLMNASRIKLKEKKGKSFLNRKKFSYWKASQIHLSNVTDRMGDIITVYQRENGLVKMTVVYKLGYNTSINPINFSEENDKLMTYINKFSRLNFQEYYGGHIKNLNKTLKNVNKELKKERKTLSKMEKEHTKKFTNKQLKNEMGELNIKVQKKLVETLRAEKNHYLFLIMQYKSRNSEIRMNSINNTFNQ